MLHGSQQRKFFRQNLLQRASIRKCLDQISLSNTLKLSSLRLSMMLEKWMTCFSSLKSLSHRISGQDSRKGESCNTLGVCHQLSNGFELKHDMLSGDEGGKIKSTRVSSNSNLDNTPSLTCWPFYDIHLSNVEDYSFMCLTSIFTHFDDWKSFTKFGAKKSHEMMSYILA